jgi:hypothetical protein
MQLIYEKKRVNLEINEYICIHFSFINIYIYIIRWKMSEFYNVHKKRKIKRWIILIILLFECLTLNKLLLSDLK